MGIIIMFYRLSEGLIFHVIRSTDGHLGVSSGRATDWPYCTISQFFIGWIFLLVLI